MQAKRSTVCSDVYSEIERNPLAPKMQIGIRFCNKAFFKHKIKHVMQLEQKFRKKVLKEARVVLYFLVCSDYLSWNSISWRELAGEQIKKKM